MFGFVAPAGLTPELLEYIAGFYAAPEPIGLNMPKLCSNPDGIDAQTLAAIALGLVPVNISNGIIQSLSVLDDGCPDRNPWAWDQDLTNDQDYGTWAQSHYLHGREPTFGWLFQGFQAQHAFAAGNKIKTPTLVLVDRHDKVIDAKKAIQELTPDVDDVICNANFDPGNCEARHFDDYGHDLFTTLGRSAPIAEVRSFLEEQMDHYNGQHY
jgi:pimeloyl-ACP methyl ester carboxylesterase